MTEKLSPPKLKVITPHISVVIPTYRNAIGLPLLAERLTAVLRGLEKPWEVILVNDCSPDDTDDVIGTLSQQYPKIHSIKLAKNMGQTEATLCGLRTALGWVVITMDDDLQHEPEAIPQLLAEFETDGKCDALFAWFPVKKHSFLNNLGSKLARTISAGVHGMASAKTSAYRVIRRDIVDSINASKEEKGTINTRIFAHSKHLKFVAIPHCERLYGRSSYTFGAKFRFALLKVFSIRI